MGELKEALNYAEQALQIARDNNERAEEGTSMLSMGRALGKLDPDNFEKARDYIEQGTRRFEKAEAMAYVARGHFFLGELYADTGQKDKAKQTLEKALSMMGELGMMYWPDRARDVLERL